ncbi:MAG: DUF5676 family membrane protein [Dongiaceae bacterium]
MSTIQANESSKSRRLALVPLGWSISLLFAISYVLCIALGLIWWDFGMHQPWLQFLPGFTWLNLGSFILGLAESFAYGWYVALIFTPLYNFFSARFG